MRNEKPTQHHSQQLLPTTLSSLPPGEREVFREDHHALEDAWARWPFDRLRTGSWLVDRGLIGESVDLRSTSSRQAQDERVGDGPGGQG